MMIRWYLLLLQLYNAANAQFNQNCKKQVSSCDAVTNTYCLGVTLPYTLTSKEFLNNSVNDVQASLAQWSELRHVPRCWEVVQELLCSVYQPKCENDNGSFVEFASSERCERTREPCQVVFESGGWPSFLQCRASHFRSGCGTALQSERFNTTSECYPPLIRTDNDRSWVEDFPGCGIPCENPIFSAEEHDSVHKLVAVMGSICSGTSFFIILTFLVDWKSSKQYPNIIVFYISLCFLISSAAWMSQFVPGVRESVVCKRDGTGRFDESNDKNGENHSCAFVFGIIYFTMIAALIWFVILAYAWYLMFKAQKKAVERIRKPWFFYHAASWLMSLLLTVLCNSLAKIDGDSLSGICFVSYGSRVSFVLVPISIVFLAAFILIGAGFVSVTKIHCKRTGHVNGKATLKIRNSMIRLGIFSGLSFIFMLITIIVHIHTLVNQAEWDESYREYLMCIAQAEFRAVMSNTSPEVCELKSKPSLLAIKIHIFAFFGAGISMSVWIFRMATIKSWQKFYRRIWNKEEQEADTVKRHHVLSARQQLQANRLSFSFASTRGDDAMGLNLDLNSISSQEMTSVWSALPYMIKRNDAMVFPNMGPRRYSDSDLSSMKSISSLNHRVAQITEDIIRRHTHNQSQESQSQSQQESLDSDRSRRKKRRHRKKRSRNMAHKPFSTPSPSPASVPSGLVSTLGTSSIPGEARKGSLTSLGTNPTLTNRTTSLPQSSHNTSRVPSSDEGRATPESNRPPNSRITAEVAEDEILSHSDISDLDVTKRASKSQEFKENSNTKAPPMRSKSDIRPVKNAAVSHECVCECGKPKSKAKPERRTSRQERNGIKGTVPQKISSPDSKRRPTPKTLPTGKSKVLTDSASSSEPDDFINSSDEDIITPKLKRPPSSRIIEVEERWRSSDEDCVTPEMQRPPSACIRSFAVSSSDSLHSSDSEVATPICKRPEWARLQFTTITRETRTTIHTGTLGSSFSKSLLDKVQLDDFEDSDLDLGGVSDLEGADNDPQHHLSASQVQLARALRKHKKSSKARRSKEEHDSSESFSEVTDDSDFEDIKDKKQKQIEGKKPEKQSSGKELELYDKGVKTKKPKQKVRHPFKLIKKAAPFKHNKKTSQKQNDSKLPPSKKKTPTSSVKNDSKLHKVTSHTDGQGQVRKNRKRSKRLQRKQHRRSEDSSPAAPFDRDSEGRSRSPQLSPTQKIYDWDLTKAAPPTPPDMKEFDLEMTCLGSQSAERKSKEKKGKVNQAYDETEA